MVACHYNSTGGIWPRHHKRLCATPWRRTGTVKEILPRRDRLSDYSSLHNVARLAGHESFDIVDQLIRQNLHSFLAGPSDVRSYNEVRQIQIQEHVASRGRLISENVESGAADDAVLKRLRQRAFIDETAPRRIDENCVAPHHRQLLGANQISRIVRQRRM